MYLTYPLGAKWNKLTFILFSSNFNLILSKLEEGAGEGQAQLSYMA